MKQLRGIVALVLILAATAVLLPPGSAAPPTAEETTRQPILFPHQWHVLSVGIDCLFCHRLADPGVAAGIPPVDQCMFCHQVAGHGSPEVQKLLKASAENQPINWVRVYRVPDHVRFVHAPHVEAGVGCADCHGAVATMNVAQQIKPLKMGDCVGCHRRMNAPTDCWSCHY